MNLKKCTALFLLTVLLATLAAPAALADSTAYVSCSSLSVRASASASGAKLGTLAQGARVRVISAAGGWAKISYNGKTAYVAAKYLSKSPASSHSGGQRAYVKTGAYLYASASTSSSRVRALSKGQLVYVIGKKGSFCRVRAGKLTGYVLTKSLRKAGVSSTRTSAQKVVALAKRQLGKTYSKASSGPNSFDCSGLTYYCYAQYGVTLKRLSRSQGESAGYAVSRKSLKAGDLVFFDTVKGDGDQYDHVGIYIGNGLFIHASSTAGKVIISSLSVGFYNSAFSLARRVF